MPTRREFLRALASGTSLASLESLFGDLGFSTEWCHRFCPSCGQPACDYFWAVDMVGRVTKDSAVINLVTKADLVLAQGEYLHVRARWGTVADDVKNGLGDTTDCVSLAYDEDHAAVRIELELAGLLTGNTTYHYQTEFVVATDECGDDVDPSNWVVINRYEDGGEAVERSPGRFHTQRLPGQEFSFCALADPHWGQKSLVMNLRDDEDHIWNWMGRVCLDQILADHSANPFDFCVDLGDSAYTHPWRLAEEADKCYAHYRSIMSDVLREMPAYLVLGNHEAEGGYFQRGDSGDDGSLSDTPGIGNHLADNEHLQKWSTVARRKFVPNPKGGTTNGPATYPEGGERGDTWGEWGNGNPGGSSPEDQTGAAPRDGKPLQNFYAWTWGDALFVVLDPFRYTKIGSPTVPESPSDWTLGQTQMRWLEEVLRNSCAKWKFIFSHQQVGGGLINGAGCRTGANSGEYAYGRGSAREVFNDDPEVNPEQAYIHALMKKYYVQFFVYGHDHIFCHSVRDGIHYLSCGRPTFLSSWFTRGGMIDSYGTICDTDGCRHQYVEKVFHVLGYTRFHVTPDHVRLEWVRTGFDFGNAAHFDPRGKVDGTPYRRYREHWLGRQYAVNNPSYVEVANVPTLVAGVRTPTDGVVTGLCPGGPDTCPSSSLDQADCDEAGDPPGNHYTGNLDDPHPNKRIPLQDWPGDPHLEPTAVVDYVPEVIYAMTFNRRADGTCDYDRDGDVDMQDYLAFQACHAGPGNNATADCIGAFDANRDGDVDLDDFFNFQTRFTGTSGP